MSRADQPTLRRAAAQQRRVQPTRGEVTDRIWSGLDRLYRADFCGRFWLSTFAADVTLLLESLESRSAPARPKGKAK
jgi:hypothetical protein